MKKWIIVLAVSISLGCMVPETEMKSDYRIAFYNVENLYDTIDNPDTDDDFFLPTAETHWDTKRYFRKIDHLAEVISSMRSEGGELPVLVGLAEIENKVVLGDLCAHKDMVEAGYSFIHEDSPDERGADVALLFRKGLFAEISHKAILVLPGGGDHTRDILYVEGLMAGQTVHIFINHWPSRREGQKESEFRRIAAANVLRSAVDRVLEKDATARIIIMGDFNDEPDNRSIREVLAAAVPGEEEGASLYNLSFKAYKRGEGSYYYRYEEKWNMLDQIIVSESMLNDTKGLYCPSMGVRIHRKEFMLYYQKGKESIPNRTYGGSRYHGGYSDHLPVYTDLLPGSDYSL